MLWQGFLIKKLCVCKGALSFFLQAVANRNSSVHFTFIRTHFNRNSSVHCTFIRTHYNRNSSVHCTFIRTHFHTLHTLLIVLSLSPKGQWYQNRTPAFPKWSRVGGQPGSCRRPGRRMLLIREEPLPSPPSPHPLG